MSMLKQRIILPCFILLLCIFFCTIGVSAEKLPVEYYYEDGCPTCEAVSPLIDKIEQEYNDSIIVNRYKLPEYYDQWKDYGFTTTPAVVVNSTITLESGSITLVNLHTAINFSLEGQPVDETDECNKTTPFGVINVCEYSLPVLTILLGAIDSFNPCSFFILIFLLNLLLYIESRKRMALVGGIFITISGVVYFILMLLLFLASTQLYSLIDQSFLITLVIGSIAIILGGLMLKDFFFFKQGPNIGLSEEKKKTLFKRIRGIVQTTNIYSMIVGTILLAVLANIYELGCTLALPFTFTITLKIIYEYTTLAQALPYLLLYNIVYVIPLFIIVGFITWKLDKRKLSEWQGRILKLFSGMMMTLLGISFIIMPHLLKNIFSIIGIIVLAIIITASIVVITNYVKKKK